MGEVLRLKDQIGVDARKFMEIGAFANLMLVLISQSPLVCSQNGRNWNHFMHLEVLFQGWLDKKCLLWCCKVLLQSDIPRSIHHLRGGITLHSAFSVYILHPNYNYIDIPLIFT
jgi:hypothetical protein